MGLIGFQFVVLIICCSCHFLFFPGKSRSKLDALWLLCCFLGSGLGQQHQVTSGARAALGEWSWLHSLVLKRVSRPTNMQKTQVFVFCFCSKLSPREDSADAR